MILYTPPTRLMGRKCLISIALTFLGNKSSVEAPFKLTPSMTLVKNIYDIFFKNFLTRLEEESHREKPSRPRALTIQSFHHLKDPTLLKSSIHPHSLFSINKIKMKTIQFGPPTKLL